MNEDNIFQWVARPSTTTLDQLNFLVAIVRNAC